MPVPRRRRSRSKQGTMRAHKRLSAPTYTTCPNCGAEKQPHHVCPKCGQYKGRTYKIKVVR